MPMDDKNRVSMSHQHIDAGRVHASQRSAAGRRSTEGKVWHPGRNPEVHHTPWSRVMRRKIRLARAVAGLTGRIETIVVLIPRSDRESPVDAEEFHDQRCRLIGPAKQGQRQITCVDTC